MRSIAEPEIYEPYLDGLRGVAILMVLAFHTSLAVTAEPEFPEFRETIEHLSRGVHLFFIVSALTLFRASWFRFPREGFSATRFYARRAFRILPLWWLAVLLQIWVGPKYPTADVLATAFLYFGFFRDAWHICLIPVGWSLFIEESFYWFFPAWFRWIKDIRWAAVGVALSYGVAWIWYSEAWRLQAPSDSHFEAIFPPGNYFAFFLGILIYFVLENRRRYFGDNQPPTRMRIGMNALSLLGVLAIFVYDRMMGSAALAAIVLTASFPSTLFGKICRNPIIVRYGACCYSIYLFHAPLLGWLSRWQADYFKGLGASDASLEVKSLLWFIIVAPLSLLVGTLSFRLIELPIVRWGRSLLRSRPRVLEMAVEA